MCFFFSQFFPQDNKLCLWNTNVPATAIFLKLWPWQLTLTLTDDCDFGTKKGFYPKKYTGIYVKCESSIT